MFEDSANSWVGFVGNDVTISREFSASQSQTSICETQDKLSQTRSFADKSVQTEVALPVSYNLNEAELNKFLDSAQEIIKEEIIIYVPQFDMDIDEMNTFGRCKKLFEIMESPLGLDKNRMRVTLLLWKRERSLLYVGYSSQHTEWCSHFGFVRLYLFHEKEPDFRFILLNELAASACVTSMDIHPFIPHILAAGTFSGEITLWNTNKTDNNVIATSYPYNSEGSGHNEAVSQILWLKKIDIYDKYPMLITSGLDGVLLLWQYAPISEALTLYTRVVLQPEYIQTGVKANYYGFYNVPLKITCFSVGPDNPLALIIGMDGGHILYLSINTTKENMAVSKKGESYYVLTNPILARYESHAASVTDVQHIRYASGGMERFVTASLDKCIKIFKQFQETPIQVLYSNEVIMGLFFWDLDPSKLIAWGCTQISVYDLPSGKRLGSPTFHEESQDNILTTAITCNGHHTFLMGKLNGSISAWKIVEG